MMKQGQSRGFQKETFLNASYFSEKAVVLDGWDSYCIKHWKICHISQATIGLVGMLFRLFCIVYLFSLNQVYNNASQWSLFLLVKCAYILCIYYLFFLLDWSARCRPNNATEFWENILSVTMLETTRSKDPICVWDLSLLSCLFFDCYTFMENILF